MDEYVQYHNTEYAEFPVEKPGLFSIYTSKAPQGIQGSRVWLVARKRDTREYYLVYWFIVDTFVPGEAGEPNSIEGRSGAWLRPVVRIDQLAWFDTFLKYMGNFGLGLQKIADPALVMALRAAADAERLEGGASISFAAEIKKALPKRLEPAALSPRVQCEPLSSIGTNESPICARRASRSTAPAVLSVRPTWAAGTGTMPAGSFMSITSLPFPRWAAKPMSIPCETYVRFVPIVIRWCI